MTYTVRWKQSALNDLASLWTAADSTGRREITPAAHAIDQQLQADPDDLGESRPGGRRVFFVPPLGVLYRVDVTRGVVRVLQVWLF